MARTSMGEFNKLFKEGIRSDFMKEFSKSNIQGEHFETMVIDDVLLKKEPEKRLMLMPRSFYKHRLHALNFGISKEMLDDSIYDSCFKLLKDFEMYIDPTKLSKKQLIDLVMSLQGLVAGLLETIDEQDRTIKSNLKQIECLESNVSYQKNKADAYTQGLKDSLKIVIDNLKSHPDD